MQKEEELHPKFQRLKFPRQEENFMNFPKVPKHESPLSNSKRQMQKTCSMPKTKKDLSIPNANKM